MSTRPVAIALALLLASSACDRKGEPAREPLPFEKALPAVKPSAPVAAAAAKVEATGLPAIADLVEQVKAAVVNVEVKSMAAAQEPDEMLPPFMGGGPGMAPPVQQGLGSGFIIDERGFVLTNHHVVTDAVDIRVKLEDGRSYDAEVVGKDPLTDVALLKLKGDIAKLPTVALGDSDAMRVGEWVMAIGNPFGLASSVSLGILSARARNIHAGPYDDFLQTDAAINPGNSGGPLFNLKGEVIGINTAIVGSGSGIGFAVPSNLVRALVPQLQASGEVTRGWLGVSVQDLSEELAAALKSGAKEGAVVLDVNRGSPAEIAGLQRDDVIFELDGRPLKNAGDLTRRVALLKPDGKVELTLSREGKQKKVTAQLGTRPDLEGLSKKPPRAKSPTEEEHSRIGLLLRDLDAETRMTGMPAEGALVMEVQSGSPAERAGLVAGMVLVEANRKPVKNTRALVEQMKALDPGATVLLRAARPGGKSLHALTLP